MASTNPLFYPGPYRILPLPLSPSQDVHVTELIGWWASVGSCMRFFMLIFHSQNGSSTAQKWFRPIWPILVNFALLLEMLEMLTYIFAQQRNIAMNQTRTT